MSPACRVFLAGEGPSDIGDAGYLSSYRTGRDGFLQPILRKLVGDAFALQFEGRKLTSLARTKVKTVAALLSRHAAQAYVLAPSVIG